MQTESLVGKTLICAETGKQFIGAKDGCSTNYAKDAEGLVLSDEGVDLREKKQLLDRSKPFGCYLSSDGKHVTGWKGNILGRVVRSSVGGGFGGDLTHVRVVDVHGNPWHGKGAGRGMCITLRPSKH
jgi:hypothetical protein